jgi:nitrogen fixation NifU-like protein
MAYGPKVLDHYENPRNVGVFDKDDTTQYDNNNRNSC